MDVCTPLFGPVVRVQVQKCLFSRHFKIKIDLEFPRFVQNKNLVDIWTPPLCSSDLFMSNSVYHSLVSVQPQKQLFKSVTCLAWWDQVSCWRLSSYIPVWSMTFMRALMIYQCSSAITMHDWVCSNQVTWILRLSASLGNVASFWRLLKHSWNDVDDPVWQLSAYARSTKQWQSASSRSKYRDSYVAMQGGQIYKNMRSS